MRLAIALCALAAAAFADGGMVVPPDVAIAEYGQVAIIRHQDGIEQLSVSGDGQESVAGFGVESQPAMAEDDGAAIQT